MGRRIIIISLFIIVGCKGKTHPSFNKPVPKDTTTKLLIFGLPDPEMERAMNTLSKKYGFQYFRVTGCVVSSALHDSTNKENKITRRKLDTKYGPDWHKKFALQVDTMYHQQMQVETLLRKMPYIAAKEQELEKNNNGLHFEIEPRENKNIFRISRRKDKTVPTKSSAVYKVMSYFCQYLFQIS